MKGNTRSEGSGRKRVAPTLSLTIITSLLYLWTVLDVAVSTKPASQCTLAALQSQWQYTHG